MLEVAGNHICPEPRTEGIRLLDNVGFIRKASDGVKWAENFLTPGATSFSHSTRVAGRNQPRALVWEVRDTVEPAAYAFETRSVNRSTC